MATPGTTSAKSNAMLSTEHVVSVFNELRQQQRILASKISEIEMDMKEHDLVIEVLKGVEPTRKCYRMIGGVLVERTVVAVLPGLTTNREKMKEYKDSLQNSLEAKGKELIQFREKYGIQFRADNMSEDKREGTAAKASDRQANILASI